MKPLAKDFLLSRGYCCGNKCKNCPYTPKHKKVMWLDIVKALFDISSKRQELEEARRLRIADVFLDISKLLDETANELEKDIYPGGKCHAMKVLADELLLIIRDKMEEQQWHNLNGMLQQACGLEKEYANRKDSEVVDVLRQTAGHFHAKSLIFKVL